MLGDPQETKAICKTNGVLHRKELGRKRKPQRVEWDWSPKERFLKSPETVYLSGSTGNTVLVLL